MSSKQPAEPATLVGSGIRRAMSAMNRQKSSTPHYQTFPTAPPKTRGRPPRQNSSNNSSFYDSSTGDADDDDSQDGTRAGGTPLPVRQLAILGVIALAEQTAFNSISPYLPEMTSTFPEADASEIGLYVGTIASAFALAQFATNFFWGWASDRIGRKPVIMFGTISTAACFVAFGFCRTLWQAIIVQILMGIVNGNQGVVSTCLGEITDRTNQSKAFVYLPVIYGIGGITGPAIGGLLVMRDNTYPYLLPNLFSALVLMIDLVLTGFFLEESLEEAKSMPPLQHRLRNLFSWLWQFTSGARSPTYLRERPQQPRVTRLDGTIEEDDSSDAASENHSLLSVHAVFPQTNSHLASKEIFNRNTIILLSTYLVFQLSNIAFNSLYPIFASADEPTGRELSPEEIGLSLSFAGIVTIIFQVAIFGKLKEKMGNKATYRAGLFLFFLAMMSMPWVGYRNSRPPLGWGSPQVWLWVELGFVLLVKTVAAVGGLTSALLLITNSAPNHSVLGTLNGLAQTLSAAGRAAGPFLSGGLFSIATRVQPKGEALAWGIFGGIALVGWAATFGIQGNGLESAEWAEEHGSSDGSDGEEEA